MKKMLDGKSIDEIIKLKREGLKINILNKEDFEDIKEDELEDLPEITDEE